MRSTRLVAAVAAALVAVSARAEAQNVMSDVGTISTVGAIEEVSRSRNMQGMRVSATFVGGGTFSGLWADLGSTWGVDFYDGNTHKIKISMGGDNDTFLSDWTINLYQNSPNLRSLLFEGGANYGGVVFDRSSGFAGGAEGTPGSNVGNDFDLNFFWNGVNVTYANAIGLGVLSPFGDLFQQVYVDFSNARICLTPLCFFPDRDVPDSGNNGMTFRMDSDHALSLVPEPSTYALMAAGLAAIGLVARRRLERVA